MIFRYKLLNRQGFPEKGTISLPFEEETQALRYLERDGAIVVDLRSDRSFGSIWEVFGNILGGGVRAEDSVVFYRDLSVLLSAGVSILKALDDMAVDLENDRIAKRSLCRIIKFIRADVESGMSFSEALSRHERIFPAITAHMIRVGEETGRLDEMLSKAAEHVENVISVTKATKRALVYPLMLCSVISGLIFFWLSYVVPRISAVFAEMKIKAPFSTGLLNFIGAFSPTFVFTALAVMIFAAVVVLSLKKKLPALNYALSLMMLKAPFVGRIIETSLTSRVAEYLGRLHGAGLGIVKSLEIIAVTVGNIIYSERLLAACDEIRAGSSLSAALRRKRVMPAFALRIIEVGEKAGSLERQAMYVASTYRERLNGFVETARKIIEPVLILIMGIVFIFIAAGLLLPIYDLVQRVE